MRYQTVFAWIALVGFSVGAAVASTGCIGTRFGLWDYAHGLTIVAPGVGIGMVALASGLTWIVRALWHNDSRGWRIGASGLIGSALLVGIPAHHQWLLRARPPICDISTDIGDAPQFRDLLALRHGAANPPEYDGPKPVVVDGEKMPVSLAQKYAYLDIKPLERLAGAIPQNEFVNKYFWRSLNAVNALNWQVVGYDIKAGRIEAISRSFWFGISSDIVIRVRPAGVIGVRVDIRSKSRVGKGDAGRNADLVRIFIARVKNH
jgi:hypothetical protein